MLAPASATRRLVASAAALLVPYLARTAFATNLTAATWQLNR